MKMEKYLTIAALIGVIGFTWISMAGARGYYGAGYGYCNGNRYCDNWNNFAGDDEKVSAFLEETKEIRKQIVVKRSELDALMQQDNPDEGKAASLTGELFDLQNTLETKADRTFEGNSRYGYGPGAGYGNCGRRGGW